MSCRRRRRPISFAVCPLADAAGWVDVDQTTLRHKSFENIWSLGDVMNAPNAKTAAAARKQAPVVAQNLLADMGRKVAVGHYDGYGSCPLTVERGKIVLAEFGYGGKLLPSFPGFLIDGTKPSRLSWLLKERILPPIYWKAMLKGQGMDGQTREVVGCAAEVWQEAVAWRQNDRPTWPRCSSLPQPVGLIDIGETRTSTMPRKRHPLNRLARLLPVLEWGRRYNRDALTSDLVAAVIVTIMLIPQSLAYALLAGLPPETGIYASIAADRPLCHLRHQPGAGRRSGRGGVADDRGSDRAIWPNPALAELCCLPP